MEAITRDEFARELGIIDRVGEISRRGLAKLLRAPLDRWGLSARTAILRHARRQLDAASVLDRASPLLNEVLDGLVRLGEYAEVDIGHQRYIAPTMPRWMPTGPATGAMLGAAVVPEGVVELPGDGGRDLVRRIRVRDDDDLATLHIAGIRETSLEEWLRPLGYLRHAARRKGGGIRSDEVSLSQFWELLEATLTDEGLPLGDEAEVRAVTGEPVGFFGQFRTEQSEGRWSDSAPDGVWCAYRRGYSEAHWHPIIVAVNGGERRALDLFDTDEWRWALLARAHRIGADERVERLGSEIRLTFPAPEQFATAMDLLGPRRGPWSWAVGLAAPDPWKVLAD